MNELPPWEISLGIYPGILLGIRTYKTLLATEYVLYIPFFDISLTIYKEEN